MEKEYMKRLAVMAAALIIFLTAGAGGAEQGQTTWEQFGLPADTGTPAITATPAPNAFRFRDGIRWGMTPQQVQALETEKMTERSMADWSIMLTDSKVVVSRFTADLVFMFRQNQLQMISYEFPNARQDDFLYLGGALGTVYGEADEADPLTIKALMDAINPNRYKTEQIREAAKWITADSTTIYLYFYAANAFAITYVSPEMGSKIYQINGL